MEALYVTGGHVKCAAPVEKSGRPSKVKKELLYDPATPLLRIYPRDLKICLCKSVCNDVHNSSIIPNGQEWKQLECSSTSGWINKMWSMPLQWNTIWQYKEMSYQATIWKNLRYVLLSGRSQSENSIYSMISFI